MKNGVIVAILLVVWGAIKAFFKLLKAVVHVLSSLIVFLGLYIPLFYLVFGIILLATTDFTFGGTGTDQVLYYIGFGLSLIAAAIIGVRNALIRPIASIFEPFRDYAEERRRERESDREREERARDRRRRGRDEYDEGVYGREQERRGYRSDGRGYPREPYPYREQYPYREPAPMYYDRGARYDQDLPAENYRGEPADPYYDRRGGYGADYPAEPERPLVYYSQRRPGVLVKEYSDRFELFREDADGRHFIGTEYKDE